MAIEGDLSNISENLKQSMESFCKFIQADKIVFHDNGNKETFEIHKNNQTFFIHACSNKCDGGFFGFM